MSAPEPVAWMVIDASADPDERVAALYLRRADAETWREEHYQIIPLYAGPCREEWAVRQADGWVSNIVYPAPPHQQAHKEGGSVVRRLVGEWQEVKRG